MIPSYPAFLQQQLKGNSRFQGKHIECIFTPGNHDIDFNDLDRGFNEIDEAFKNNTLCEIITKDIASMNAFWKFVNQRKCFWDGKVISKKVFSYNEYKVGFVMVNSAPLSLLGGNAQDMGIHFLTEEELTSVEEATEAEVNILVMHHSIEWFTGECKDKLRIIISRKYTLLLTGHEHEPVGESRNINGNGDIQCVQGNALRGYSKEGNGFCTISMNFENDTMDAHSFIWKEDLYTHTKILSGSIKKTFHGNIQINQYLKALIDYKGIQRVEQYMFHRDAFREILLNAIVHKDYSGCNPI